MRKMAWLLGAAILLGACSLGRSTAPTLIGAIYPLSGPQAPGGQQELAGLRAALEVAQRQGLARAADVQLKVLDVQTPYQAIAAVDRLVDQEHVQVIVGSYGSDIAIAAATRADQRRVVYWETGAVADEVTLHRRYVFRTVATGSTLGRMAARFTAQVLVPQAGITAAQARVVVVHTTDPYGRSVADGEAAQAKADGLQVVAKLAYDPRSFDPAEVVSRLAAARPDYLWDVSYLDDGIAIWQAVLDSKLQLRAAIGTSSAFCMPDFQRRLGSRATGVYAADKPDQVVSPAALSAEARGLLAEAAARYGALNSGAAMGIPGVAGFVGGWALFHDVLPKVKGGLTADAVRAAALEVDVPSGQEINGAGIKFAPQGNPDAGQNRRAAAVVGQWQADGQMKVLFPPAFATGA